MNSPKSACITIVTAPTTISPAICRSVAIVLFR